MPHDPEPLARDVEQPTGGLGDGLRADDDRGRIAQQLRPEPVPEPAGDRLLERPGHLPGRDVEERRHDRQPGRDRQRAAADDVVDGARGSAALGAPRRAQATRRSG